MRENPCFLATSVAPKYTAPSLSPAVPPERLLQEARELAVAEGHVRTVLAKRPDDPSQSVQGHIDAVGLLQSASLRPRLSRPFRPRQVHEGEAAGHFAVANDIPLLYESYRKKNNTKMVVFSRR